MRALIVGNWKMNLDPEQAGRYVERLMPKLAPKADVTAVVCAPAVDLYPLSRSVDASRLKLGAQNCHYEDEGAFTGETSPATLSRLVDYVIIGHSERRAMGEEDKTVARKLVAVLRHGLTPILCVGEHLADREHGLTVKTVTAQLTAALHDLTASDVAQLVVAYEPVWAIGTGRFAGPDDVTPVVAHIRQTIEELYGEDGSSGVRVLYGGSVDPDNAAAYLRLDGIDGLLVGGASLNYEKFASIIATAEGID